MSEIGGMNNIFDVFKSFLLGEIETDIDTFLDEKPLTYYRDKIENIFEDATPQTILELRNKGIGIDLNVQHLMELGSEELMDLRGLLEKEPKKTIDRMNGAFKEVVINLSGDVGITEFYVHPYNIENPYLVNEQSHKIKVRALGKQHSEHLVIVEGTITKASPVKPLLREGTYQCLSCNNEFSTTQPKLGQYIAPNAIYKRCPNAQCRSKNLSTIQIIENRCKVTPWQLLTIQEPPEELPSGSTPNAIDLVCLGDYVDKVSPGVKIEATGILYLRPDFNPARSSHTNPEFDFFVHVLHIKENLEDEVNIEITDEDMEEIERIKNLEDDKIRERFIVNGISPSMYGNYPIKHGIALQQFGGVEHKIKGEKRTERSQIHILLAGDPGTAKTNMLSYTKELNPRRWSYALGSKTSLAGLVAGIVKHPKSGVLVLEAGACVLASGGTMCLDEFAELDKIAKNALLEVMVNRQVSINKAGIQAKLPAECSVLAAMNPQYRRYKRGKTFGENMDLDDAIASRFDLIFLMLDEADKDFDSEYMDHIFDVYEDDIEEDSTEDQEESISKELLLKYIQVAKELRPKLTIEAKEHIKQYYIDLRSTQYGIEEESGRYADRRTPHTIRRLAEANAKLNMRNEVTPRDVDVVFDLYQHALKEIAKDPFGGYDIDAVSGITTKKYNISEKVKGVLLELEEDAETSEEYTKQTGVPFSVLLEKCLEEKILVRREGVDVASQLESVLNTMVKLGDVVQPLDGSSSKEPTYRMMKKVVKRTITRKKDRQKT